MSHKLNRAFLLTAVAATALAASAQADVFDMGGTQNADGSWNGTASLETITVGNPGNAADDTGYGAVDYVYKIGKFEVTNAQYVEFLNAVAAADTYELYSISMWNRDDGCKIQQSGVSGSYTYSVATDRANRPVNFVDWGDAVRFANWLHNGQPIGAQDPTTTEDGAYCVNGAVSSEDLMEVTLKSGAKWWIPSEDEWYKAAYHKNDGVTGNYFDYTTGSDAVPSNDLVNPDPGNNANFYQGGCTIDSPYYMTEVGEFENSESPYGTFDQGGNVWEWNDAVVPTSSRGLRGGGWSFQDHIMHVSDRLARFPTHESNGIGFRVASVPEPGSLGLLMFGVAALACRRRRR